MLVYPLVPLVASAGAAQGFSRAALEELRAERGPEVRQVFPWRFVRRLIPARLRRARPPALPTRPRSRPGWAAARSPAAGSTVAAGLAS
jgi:hypothetical protein